MIKAVFSKSSRTGLLSFERGKKIYELSNDLGNVLATVSDRRIAVDTNQNSYLDYYLAEIRTTARSMTGFRLMEKRENRL